MDRTTFVRLLAKHFYPSLRSEGFKGSGTTLRRRIGPVLHVFNLQGSTNTEEFYVNLGASLVPLGINGLTEQTSLDAKEYQCVFRQRLDPINQASRRWRYGKTQDDAIQVIGDLAAAWATKGRDWFKTYATFPVDFRRLVDEATYKVEHPAHILTLARIARLLGDDAKCAALASEALPRVPAQASILLAELAALAGTAREA